MKKLIYPLIALLALVACDDTLDDVAAVSTVAPTVEVVLPAGMDGATVTAEEFAVKNVTTGRTAIYRSRADLELTTGLYDISYDADLLLADGVTGKHVQAFLPSVEVTSAQTTLRLAAYEAQDNDDFIISEIFFAGTLRPNGSQYYGDDYIKIYNNTDRVLYADGLTLLESKFVTTDKYNYRPNVMDTAMTVQALYTVPGSGHDHPVNPGEELWIVDTGIDHRVANENSFDCSGADFEWYDKSTQPAHLDIDGPVANLDKWYCYTLSFFVLHNRGFRAWAIARIPMDKEQYLADERYYYTYKYVIIAEAGTYPMSQQAFMVPNRWIVDAVNCSVEAEYEWNVTAPSLDRGWTHCGTMDHDKSRYFHSVRRKMLYVRDGRAVLKDTNNSSEDFNPMVIPSEIERQRTAVDFSGTPCSTLTWDGVIPK